MPLKTQQRADGQWEIHRLEHGFSGGPSLGANGVYVWPTKEAAEAAIPVVEAAEAESLAHFRDWQDKCKAKLAKDRQAELEAEKREAEYQARRQRPHTATDDQLIDDVLGPVLGLTDNDEDGRPEFREKLRQHLLRRYGYDIFPGGDHFPKPGRRQGPPPALRAELERVLAREDTEWWASP